MTIAVSLGAVSAMPAIARIAVASAPEHLTCREVSRLPIAIGMNENRFEAALGEHRRQAALPEPSRRRALRRRVGLSQSVIADAIGVSPPTVSRIEAGISSPRGDVLARYLQILALLAAEGDDTPDVRDAAARRRRAEAARACRHDKE
jgi:DNA-binding transcriptional regulator YiaG